MPVPPAGYKLVICFLTREEDLYRHIIYGPQAQTFTPCGDMPPADGRRIGVAWVPPETFAIIQAAHAEEYICDSWNALLTRTDLTPYVAWRVQLQDGTVKLERDLTDEERPFVMRTPSGRHKLRFPLEGMETPDFDPDYIPRVGTMRVHRVVGAVDQEHVVLTDAEGVTRWFNRATGDVVDL